jgi:hypothetical protein
MLIDAVVLIVFGVFYSTILLSYYRASKTYFVACYLLLAIFHDYIFINLEYEASESIILIVKSWQEMLFLFLCVNMLARVFTRFKVSSHFLITGLFILILTGWGVFVSILEKDTVFEIFLGWRKFMLTLFNSILLYELGVFDKVSFRSVYRLLVVATLVIMAYGFYQLKKFDAIGLPEMAARGTDFYARVNIGLREFWFYEKFGDQHMLRSWPNYMRNDSPRITSVFVSPIVLAEYLALVALFSIITLVRGKPKVVQVIFHGLFLFLIFLTMETSQTRIGYIQVFVGTIVSLIIVRNVNPRFYLLLAFGSIAALFVAISFGNIADSSAQGRIPQYLELLTIFSLKGYGFGDEERVLFFDSLYISVILLFGVFSLLYFYIHYYWIRLFLKYYSRLGDDKELDLEYRIIVASLCSFIFAFAFQFSLGTAIISILYFLLFLGISRQNKLIDPA